MWIFILLLCASHLFLPSSSLHFIDVPTGQKTMKENSGGSQDMSVKDDTASQTENGRRFLRQSDETKKKIEEEHDKHLKTKISILIQQTIHDTTKKIETIQKIKAENRNRPEYKAGFLVNLIKKSKDVVNELFSVGVKHKDDWKALEQMKTYELLVHANVDTDNLVKQLVEVDNMAKKAQQNTNVQSIVPNTR